MTATILYTTTDAIRSALGIDIDDMTDEVVGGQFLDLLMMERLQDILPNYEILADTDDAILNRLKLWCTFYGALTLAQDASLGIPMKIQANTDQMQRFPVDFEKLVGNLKAKVGWLESRLNPTYSNAGFKIMGAATPDYDPISGPLIASERSLLVELALHPIRNPVV